MKSFAVLLATGLLASATPALAHHSYSMFDLTNRSTISGSVAKLEWGNPHVFIWVYVPNAKGAYDLYGLEAGAVTLLTRYGWNKDSLKSGDKVTLDYFPLKNKQPGGAFINLTKADGTVLRNEPFAPGGSDPSAYRINGSPETKAAPEGKK